MPMPVTSFKKNAVALAAAGLLVLAAAGGATASLLAADHPAALEKTAIQTSVTGPVGAGPIALTTAPNYRAIVAQNSAAVVGITSDGEVKVSDENQRSQDGPMPPDSLGNDPFFRYFRQLPSQRGPTQMRALGSGFIISPDGLILTNAHVVQDARRVTVKLDDRREFKAKVLGSDSASDIAVLKIDAHDLPTTRVGDSDQLAVGDYVLAIGQPFGFAESASAGIVSAKGRSLPGESYVPFIQTDVAVNPGNSGGPLFDASGAVVGINSQIYSNTGGYQGLSFAIPINVALNIKDQIVAQGSVDHAHLGVEVQALTQSLAQSFNLDKPEGALVSKVEPDSAAARAGIKPGDVILKYDGQPVSDAAQLSADVGMAEPDMKVTLDLWRNGKPLSLEAELKGSTNVASADSKGAPIEKGRLGLEVRPLTSDERQQVGVPAGLLVKSVTGPAAEAGIEPGDVVLSVDGTPVSSAEQIRGLIHAQVKQIALLIQRGDSRIFIPIALG